MKERITVRVELASGAPGEEITSQGQFVEFDVERSEQAPRVAVRLLSEPLGEWQSPWMTVRSDGERSK